MSDPWQQAITDAERALSGDTDARRRAWAAALALCGSPVELGRPGLGRDLTYLVTLLETLGHTEASHALLQHVVSRLLWDPESLPATGDLRDQLAVALADRGHLSAAATLLSTAVSMGPHADGEPVGSRSLANLAAVKLRLGDLTGARSAAERAQRLGATDEPAQIRLETELLTTSVLAETARRQGRDDDADRLVDAIADTARQLARRLGDGHPTSLSALVTLARAEFGSALAVGDHARMERAVDVIAVAAQKASAMLGPRHPLCRSILANLAATEFEAARATGDARRIEEAEALVRAAAEQADGERRPAVRLPTPPPTVPPDAPPVPASAVQGTATAEPTGPPKWAAEGAEILRFGVLGPVRIWREGETVSTGSPQQRALLVVLLLREGRTATASELIDALYGEDPPSQALAAIRTYASRLRKTLEPGLLVSESGGYALRVPAGSLDLNVAQDLAAEAERARAAGERSRARALIGKALALWDGEPLASIPGPYAETQRLRLEEWRLQLLETRLDVDMETGAHAEAVSELTALTAKHPLRERLRELLMLALYRCGRQAEALAVYADTRRLLAEELGVAPRPDLNELQARILQADPELGRPADEATPATALARPAQLPATVPDFTGRTSLVRDLIEALYAADASVMAVAAIAGIGGVGKTTLAVHVGHKARQHFPDGQLYVDLQGAYAQADSPETVLGSFLRALGTPDAHIPDGLQDRAALYRSVLDGRRVLVVLDNARDAGQIRHLLPGTAGCAALITSRVRMVDLAGAHLVDLGALSPEEALQLFTRIVGEERVLAERKAALDVAAACGFLPLAIRIAASRLAARRTWTVSVLAAKLADERRRLDELQAGDLAVKATLELGYGQLPPAQARAFRLLGLAEGPDVSLAAAAAMLDLPLEETEDLLEALVDTSLLESAGPGRYRYDDLVRLYARAVDEMHRAGADQGPGGQPPSEGQAALARLLDFYLATAAHAYAIERPGDALAGHLEPTSVQRLEFTDRNEARDWLYTEASCLLACARQATSPRTLRRAADLLWSALDLAESGANSREFEVTATALRDAALEQADVRAERRILVALSSAHEFAGRFDEAASEAELVLSLSGADQDRLPVCWATHVLGLIAVQRQRPEAAETHFHQAVAGFREIGDRAGEARALSGQARLRLQTGNTIHALVLAERSTAIFDDMGHVVGAAGSRYTLGLALAANDRLTEAVKELNRALAVFRESGHRLWEGTTHYRLAAVQLAAHHPTEAALHAEQALATGCVGGESVRAGVLTVLGRSLDALGQSDRARACWHEALAIHEQAGTRQEAETAGLHSLISRRLRSA